MSERVPPLQNPKSPIDAEVAKVLVPFFERGVIRSRAAILEDFASSPLTLSGDNHLGVRYSTSG